MHLQCLGKRGGQSDLPLSRTVQGRLALARTHRQSRILGGAPVGLQQRLDACSLGHDRLGDSKLDPLHLQLHIARPRDHLVPLIFEITWLLFAISNIAFLSGSVALSKFTLLILDSFSKHGASV